MIRKLFDKKNKRWALTDRMFFSLFITGTIIEFSIVGAGFIDGLIIGRFLGAESLAAEGIAHPIYSIIGVISGLLYVGMQVRCAQELGRGNSKKVSVFFSATVYVGVILSFILLFVTQLFSKNIATILGASGNAASLAEPAAEYIRGIGIGVPGIIMTAIFGPALQLDGSRKAVQNGAIIDTVTNIVMDIVAVKLGLGLFGVGVATALAAYSDFFYLAIKHLTKKNKMLRFVRPDISIKEFFIMLSNGTEKASIRIVNTVRPIILNGIIISYGGTAAMSAFSVRNNFSNFAEIVGTGIASAVLLLMSVYYGEVNEEAIKEVNSYEHKLILWLCGGISVLVFILAKPIALLYVSNDENIINMVVFAIRVLAIQLPLKALIDCRVKYLQAIHRKFNMNLLIFVTRLLCVVISAFVCGRLFGVYGILSCYTVSDIITLAFIYLFYAIKERKIIVSRDALLNLPKYFILHPGNVISLDIRNGNDVSICAEQIMLFAKAHGIDNRIAYNSSLAFEELANNIIEHGFPKSKEKIKMIDLRVVITEKEYIIRLCDNCPQYDITQHLAEVNKEDADLTKNIGIRIISKIAKDISYLNTFETNNLIIRFEM